MLKQLDQFIVEGTLVSIAVNSVTHVGTVINHDGDYLMLRVSNRSWDEFNRYYIDLGVNTILPINMIDSIVWEHTSVVGIDPVDNTAKN